MIDKLVAGGKVALSRLFKAFPLFLSGKLTGKRAVASEMQCKNIRLCKAVCSIVINIISHSEKLMIQFIRDIVRVMQVHYHLTAEIYRCIISYIKL